MVKASCFAVNLVRIRTGLLSLAFLICIHLYDTPSRKFLSLEIFFSNLRDWFLVICAGFNYLVEIIVFVDTSTPDTYAILVSFCSVCQHLPYVFRAYSFWEGVCGNPVTSLHKNRYIVNQKSEVSAWNKIGRLN